MSICFTGINMDISVKRIEIGNDEHQEMFKSLFNEYASELPAEIGTTVVNQLFALSYFHGFISFVDNKPAGFAVCFESFSTYRAKKIINIHDFMVSDSYRGKGLGKAQLNGIELYCRENNYVKITLEVDDDNVAAKNLYSSCGYEDFRVVLKDLHHWQKYLTP